jgi:hypothetical protein
MKYELIENVLEDFQELQNLWCNSSNIAWYYNSSTIEGVDNYFMFTHHLYRNGQVSSDMYSSLQKLLFVASIAANKSTLLRVKANMYTNQGKHIYHTKHTDYEDLDKFTTAVFNFTTCNGGTVLYIGDEEIVVPSIENSLLVFDGNITHQGFTQTDKDNRVLLNIDFM